MAVSMALTDPTIVLSGPIAQRGPASKTLAQNGFSIADGDPTDGHGLPDVEQLVENADGVPVMVAKSDAGVSWLTVHGDDVDRAQELVSGFGWRLRAHHHGVTLVAPELVDGPAMVTEDRVAEMIAQALKGR